MRTGILADIHGNAVALDAVLEDGRRAEVQRWISLGDVVGYGPEPCECLERLRELDVRSVMGNHEARVLGLDTARFNVLAEEAVAYTRAVLSAEDRAQIEAFSGPIRWGNDALFCHGSPADRDAYLVFQTQFEDVRRAQTTRVVFHGHTHQQVFYDGAAWIDRPGDFTLGTERSVVNPGSVGQPRDGDTRAAYAIVDLETNQLQLRRVEYDLAEQLARVERAGLPRYLGERLLVGH